MIFSSSPASHLSFYQLVFVVILLLQIFGMSSHNLLPNDRSIFELLEQKFKFLMLSLHAAYNNIVVRPLFSILFLRCWG